VDEGLLKLRHLAAAAENLVSQMLEGVNKRRLAVAPQFRAAQGVRRGLRAASPMRAQDRHTRLEPEQSSMLVELIARPSPT